MARFRMLPPDVPAVDPKTGLWTADAYDLFKRLEMLGALDLFDVNNTTPITDGQVMIWNAASSKFIPGAN